MIARPERAAGEPAPGDGSRILHLAFGAILAFVAVVFLRRIFASDLVALACSVQDDSFYYLLPAFRLKSAGFFTFDGIHRTYGFQPLYELVLALLALPFGDLHLFFRAALALNLALHLGAALLLYRVVGRLAASLGGVGSAGFALLAAGFFLSNPIAVLSAQTLKENALATLLLLAIVDRLVARPESERASPAANLLVGALCAALVLARILPTTALSVAIAGSWAFLRSRRRVQLGAGFLLPLAAWGGYATVAFGGPLPTSMGVKVVEAASLAERTADRDARVGGAEFLLDVAKMSLGLRSRFVLPQLDAPRLKRARPLAERAAGWIRVAVAVGGLAAGLAALAARRRARPESVAPAVRAAPPPDALPLLLLAGMPLGYLWIAAHYHYLERELYFFTWYVYDLLVLLPLATASAGIAAARLLAASRPLAPRARAGAWPRRGLALAMIVWVLPLALFGPYRDYRPQTRRWNDAVARAAEAARTELELAPGDRVLAWDAGLLGFLLPVPVINLDGLANDEAARRVLRGEDLVPYMLSTGARYLFNANTHPEVLRDPRLGARQLLLLPFPSMRGYAIWRLEGEAKSAEAP